MFDILALLGLAAAAAGAGLQVAGTQKSAHSMNQKTLDELARQRTLQGQAQEEYAKSLTQSDRPTADAQMQKGTEQRESAYNQLQQMPLTTNGQSVLTNSTPAVNLRDVAQMQLSNRSRAKLGGYETWVLDQAVKNMRTNQQLGVLNQQAVRSQNVLPLELQNAAHAGDNLSGIGMGVGALGSLLSLGSSVGALGSMGAGAAGGMYRPPAQSGGWLY